MKKINLPSTTEDSIDLGSINEFTSGLILTYKQGKCTGFIMHDADYWYFNNSMCFDDASISEEFLCDSVQRVIKENLADEFKLIEFQR